MFIQAESWGLPCGAQQIQALDSFNVLEFVNQKSKKMNTLSECNAYKSKEKWCALQGKFFCKNLRTHGAE